MMINQIEICRREMTIIPLVMISMIFNFTVVVYRGPYGNAINLPAPTHIVGDYPVGIIPCLIQRAYIVRNQESV